MWPFAVEQSKTMRFATSHGSVGRPISVDRLACSKMTGGTSSCGRSQDDGGENAWEAN